MISLCTLFDSNYLDRGIVLYQSIKNNTNDFCLYVVCFDELTYDILKSLNFDNMIVIPEKDILSDELKKIKKERGRAEYCWTCTPVIIQYIMEFYQLDVCTYIDADMKFYDNPETLLEEFVDSSASVGIIEHRFPNNIVKNKRERNYGRYCVEFNTFRNDSNGMRVLKDWKEKCIQQCTMQVGTGGFGDQKYLETWKNQFEGVYIYQNKGAGVAPWNICDYRPDDLSGNKLRYRKNTLCQLIFYHFQSLMILENNQVFIGVYNELGLKSNVLITHIYEDYICDLLKVRKLLQGIGVYIPKQTLRKGEKEYLNKMNLGDFLLFCYQCVPSIVNRKKNYIDFNGIL